MRTFCLWNIYEISIHKYNIKVWLYQKWWNNRSPRNVERTMKNFSCTKIFSVVYFWSPMDFNIIYKPFVHEQNFIFVDNRSVGWKLARRQKQRRRSDFNLISASFKFILFVDFNIIFHEEKREFRISNCWWHRIRQKAQGLPRNSEKNERFGICLGGTLDG